MSECIEWTGAKRGNGYGVIWDKKQKKRVSVHRYFYEQEYGPIPDGKCVLHSCDNPACYNIEHLRLGTHTENMQDKVQRGRHHSYKITHCPQGHPYNEENTYSRNGERKCKECGREAVRRYRAKKKLVTPTR